MRKARRICELVREVSPGTQTVVGGGGCLTIGELVEPFSDHLCRGDGVAFFRELLGQDTDAPIRHPVVSSVHFPNVIMGCKANPTSYSLAVSLGCHRGCDFCATSAQFGRQRIPVLSSAEEILAAMDRVEADVKRQRGRVPPLHFVMFDENFLSDERLARRFMELNERRVGHGRLFLPFVFADADSLRRFSPEELLRMGIDALWIGLETADPSRFSKTRGTDFGRLVDELQAHGIKVFLSFIAGLEDATAEQIARDADYALSLGAAGYQYALACPFPGTPWWDRLEAEGRLAVERPEQLGMSHYYIQHDELDETTLRRHTSDFHRRDYERHGPLALRFLRMRLSGWRRHRRSREPALRARARAFRNDLMDATGVLSVGPLFAPTPEVRRLFVETHRALRRELHLLPALADVARGRASGASLLQFLVFSHPLVEPVARRLLAARALRWDPRRRARCRPRLGLLRHGRECVEEGRHGVMPWDQPRPVWTRYPRPTAS